MTKDKILTPLQLVELYHDRFKEYYNASENLYKEKEITERLKEIVDAGMDFESSVWEDTVADMVTEQAEKRNEVNIVAVKFSMYTQFYLLTQKEELPKEILDTYYKIGLYKDFENTYVIEAGKFVKKVDEKKKVPKETLKYVFDAIKQIAE